MEWRKRPVSLDNFKEINFQVSHTYSFLKLVCLRKMLAAEVQSHVIFSRLTDHLNPTMVCDSVLQTSRAPEKRG